MNIITRLKSEMAKPLSKPEHVRQWWAFAAIILVTSVLAILHLVFIFSQIQTNYDESWNKLDDGRVIPTNLIVPVVNPVDLPNLDLKDLLSEQSAVMFGFRFNSQLGRIECLIALREASRADRYFRTPTSGELLIYEVPHCYGSVHGKHQWTNAIKSSLQQAYEQYLAMNSQVKG